MIWEIRAVAGFAYRAGWRGDDLATATAVALATSSGDDHWRWTPAFRTDVDRRGLFGLDATMFDLDRVGDLFDPNINASLAQNLWRSLDRTWEWAAVDLDAIPYYVTTFARSAAAAPDLTPNLPSTSIPTYMSRPTFDQLRAGRTAVETIKQAAHAIVRRALGE